MSRVTGQVFKVYDKNFRGKMLYSVKLEDNPIYYRMNESRWAGIAEAGNWIEFDAEPNPDGKSASVRGQIKVMEPPASAPAASGGTYSAGGGGGAREASIHYQSARKDALQFVSIVLAQGAVKLPTKQALKLKALEALVDTYTALFVEDIGTGGAVTRATAAAYSEGAETPDGEDDEGDDE